MYCSIFWRQNTKLKYCIRDIKTIKYNRNNKLMNKYFVKLKKKKMLLRRLDCIVYHQCVCLVAKLNAEKERMFFDFIESYSLLWISFKHLQRINSNYFQFFNSSNSDIVTFSIKSLLCESNSKFSGYWISKYVEIPSGWHN